MNSKKKKMVFISSICLSVILCLSLAIYFQFNQAQEKKLLNPDKPIKINLWHFYQGTAKKSFDHLINEFNNTVGIEEGVIINALSQGNSTQLIETVYEAASNEIGAKPLPHMFSIYAENAYGVDELKQLVDLHQYFLPEELLQYDQELVKEGASLDGQKIIGIPVAKATELLYLNKTDWEKFSEATGAKEESLRTFEGLSQVAQDYYTWTDSLTEEPKDGKAFLGIESTYSLVCTSAKQLNKELWNIKEGKPVFTIDQELARNLWDNYIVPLNKGHYGKINRYCADDTRTGMNIAYIGPSYDAEKFPATVTHSLTDVYRISPEIHPYPRYENGTPSAVNLGTSMCITKSDKEHEYACSLFLKWFTKAGSAYQFSSETGYLPPYSDREMNDLIGLAEKSDITNTVQKKTIKACFEMVDIMSEDVLFYERPAMQGNFEIRKALEAYLAEPVIDVENFEQWYDKLLQVLAKATK